MLYNIRYATGTGAAFHLPVPGAGYLRSNPRVLEGITRFIKQVDPDVVGLIEVDTGSIRTGRVNQAAVIAESLGHYSTYQCKYGASSFNTLVPIVRMQANAFLAAPRVEGERFHYFDTGIKRLIIELELDELCIFLVHLSLKFRHRQAQLRHLFGLVQPDQQARDRRRRLQRLLGRRRDGDVHGGQRAAQREQRSPALLPCAPPADGTRLHPVFARHRARLLLDSGGHLIPTTGRWSATSA